LTSWIGVILLVSEAAKMDEMTGEQIQALAYDLPPVTPKGLGPAVEITAIFFGIICVIVVALRIYVRAGLSGASVNHWGVEDYLVVIGAVSLTKIESRPKRDARQMTASWPFSFFGERGQLTS
jgi:hypothetical protein